MEPPFFDHNFLWPAGISTKVGTLPDVLNQDEH